MFGIIQQVIAGIIQKKLLVLDFLVGKVFVTDSICLSYWCVWGFDIFITQSWSVVGVHTLSISSRFLNFLVYSCLCSFLVIISYFNGIHCKISFSISDYTYLGLFPLLSWLVGPMIYQFYFKIFSFNRYFIFLKFWLCLFSHLLSLIFGFDLFLFF